MLAGRFTIKNTFLQSEFTCYFSEFRYDWRASYNAVQRVADVCTFLTFVYKAPQDITQKLADKKYKIKYLTPEEDKYINVVLHQLKLNPEQAAKIANPDPYKAGKELLDFTRNWSVLSMWISACE